MESQHSASILLPSAPAEDGAGPGANFLMLIVMQALSPSSITHQLCVLCSHQLIIGHLLKLPVSCKPKVTSCYQSEERAPLRLHKDTRGETKHCDPANKIPQTIHPLPYPLPQGSAGGCPSTHRGKADYHDPGGEFKTLG